LLYLKSGLPTLLKVSFLIFIFWRISGPWHTLRGSVCQHYYVQEDNVSSHDISDSNRISYNVVRFEDVSNVSRRITASWDMLPCSLVHRNQNYGEISIFHFKGIRVLYSEDGGSIFLRRFGTFLPNYTENKSRSQFTYVQQVGLTFFGL
jgi:hypothetical protein